MDVLVPGVGEIIGGEASAKERLDVLVERMTESGLKPEGILVVFGFASLWDRTSRRIRTRTRADGSVHDRNGQHS